MIISNTYSSVPSLDSTWINVFSKKQMVFSWNDGSKVRHSTSSSVDTSLTVFKNTLAKTETLAVFISTLILKTIIEEDSRLADWRMVDALCTHRRGGHRIRLAFAADHIEQSVNLRRSFVWGVESCHEGLQAGDVAWANTEFDLNNEPNEEQNAR